MTPRAKRLLAWLQRSQTGCLLEQQVIGSGLAGAPLNELLRDGLADLGDHPTVMTRGGGGAPPCPATAVLLTDKGRTQ